MQLGRWGTAAGAVVLLFTVWWTVFPLNPVEPLGLRHGGNAVLALEFASTARDVDAVLGRDAARLASIERMTYGDFVYLLAYGTLLAVGFLRLRWRWGVPLVVVAVLGDAAENLVLLRVFRADEAGPLLPWLRVFTLVKWELLAVAAAALGVACFRAGGVARRIVGVIGVLAVPLGVATAVDAAAFSAALTLSFVPVWLWVFVESLRDARGRA